MRKKRPRAILYFKAVRTFLLFIFLLFPRLQKDTKFTEKKKKINYLVKELKSICKLIVLIHNELAADGLQPAVDEPGAGGALQLPLRHPGGLARLIQVTLAK